MRPPFRLPCARAVPARRAALAACALLAAAALRGAEDPVSPEVVARYEQILVRSPQTGPSFDRLVQLYGRGEGLDQLDERWGRLAAGTDDKAPVYALLRGLLADQLGRSEDAVRHLDAATKARPDDFRAWLALGDAAGHAGKWADAAAAYQRGLATKTIAEDRLTLYRKLGQAQQRDLAAAAALATWRKMAEEFPDDRYAVEEAGNALLDAEQYDEARKTLQRLVALAEENSMARVQALMRVAEVDSRQGRAADAVRAYEAILPLTAESSWLNRQLRAQIEQIFRRDNDVPGLVAYYRRWTQANPRDVSALLLLGAALTELDRKAESLETLRQAAALAPGRLEVREALGLRLRDAGRHDEAAKVFAALTADDPTETRYFEELGEEHWLKTPPDRAAALAAWARLAPPDTRDAGLVAAQAALYQSHRLDEEALAAWRRALALAPDAADLREKTARLLLAMKRPAEAWQTLDDLAAGDRATPASFAKLAALHQDFMRFEPAAAAIQAGLKLDPNNFELLMMEWNRLSRLQQWNEAVALTERLAAAAPDAYAAEQVDARRLQALTSAGLLDETAARLQARLGGAPGLTESELRLLLRVLAARADPATEAALAEAASRFPASVPLLLVEADFRRGLGDFPRAAAALQRLADLGPAQRLNALNALARLRQEQGDTAAALAAAGQIIGASPTAAGGYLLFAEIAFAAGQNDTGIARLQEAARLADRPNEIRLRLARQLLDLGQPAKARNVYDDAFAAAEDAAERLAIVRLMAGAYYQDGRADDLVARFRQEQKDAGEGGAGGIYLAAIYEQLQDTAAARRELTKALAARPRDAALLRSLVALAEKDGDLPELLRWRAQLAAADPTEANQLALATEYAGQNQPAAAWRVMQESRDAVLKNPLQWKDLAALLGDAELAAKARALLREAALGQGAGALAARFELGRQLLVAGNFAEAQSAFWEILATPLPPAPPAGAPAFGPPPAPPPVAPAVSLVSVASTPAGASTTYQILRPDGSTIGVTTNDPNAAASLAASLGGVLLNPVAVAATVPSAASNSPLAARAAQANLYVSDARQAIQLAQRAGFGAAPARPPAGAAQLPSDPASIRDRSLVMLASIAVQQNAAAAFLDELKARMAEWKWPAADRVLAYKLVNAREPLLAAIEEQAKSGAPDLDLDEFAYLVLRDYTAVNAETWLRDLAVNNAATGLRDRVRAAQAALQPRFAADRRFAARARLDEVVAQNPGGSPEAVAKRQEAAAAYAALLDRRRPDELLTILQTHLAVGDWPGVKADVAALLALPGLAAATPTVRQQLAALPLTLVRTQPATLAPEELVPPGDLLALLRLGYPANRPAFATPGGARPAFNASAFPPANRYLTPERANALQNLFNAFRTRGQLPAAYAALEAEEKSLADDWRRVWPALTRVYFLSLEGRRDEAAAALLALHQRAPDDDLRLLLASLYFQMQKYTEAAATLATVEARYGQGYVNSQLLLLVAAVRGGDTGLGRTVATRLLGLRLTTADVSATVLNELRNFGLADEATKLQTATRGTPARGITARGVRATGPAQPAPLSPEQKNLNDLNAAVAAKDEARAVELARKILAGDPVAAALASNAQPGLTLVSTSLIGTTLVSSTNLPANYRTTALDALKSFNRLEAYAQETEQATAAAGATARDHWLAAEAWAALPDLMTENFRPPGGGDFSAPLWLRLARAGGRVVAAFSPDGATWTEVGSRELDLGPAPLAGLVAAPYPAGRVAPASVWKNLAVKGAPAAAGPPPAPWQLATPGRATAAGAATWDGDTVTLRLPELRTQQRRVTAIRWPAPGSTGISMGTTTAPGTDLATTDGMVFPGSFLLRPLGGDGEVVALKAALADGETTDSPGSGFALALRAGPEAGAAEARLAFGPAGGLVLTWRAGTAARASAHYASAARLSPTVPMLEALVNLQLAAGDWAGVADSLGRLLPMEPAAVQVLGNLLTNFESAGRLDDLMRIVEGWNPAAAPATGGTTPFSVLANLGTTLSARNRPAEAERVLRKALALPSMGAARENAVSTLVQLLVNQGRRDAAGDELVRWFTGEGLPAAAPAPAAPLLLDLPAAAPAPALPGREALFTNLSVNLANGPQPTPPLQLLDRAGELGVLPRLRASLAAPGAQTDAARMAEAYLLAGARDPAYRDLTERLLRELPMGPSGGLGVSSGANFFMYLARLLTNTWPEERPMALRLWQRAFDVSAGNVRAMLGTQLVALTQAMDDRKAARDTLRALGADLSSGNGPTSIQLLDVAQAVVRAMIREEMLDDAAQVVQTVRNDQQVAQALLQAQSNPGATNTLVTRFNQLSAEVSFARGQSKPGALIYGIRPAAGGGADAEFLWQLRADGGQAQQGAVYLGGGRGSLTQAIAAATMVGESRAAINGTSSDFAVNWAEGATARPTDLRLELSAGPDENNLKSFVTLTNVHTTGLAPVKLPAGAAVLRAKLLEPAPPGPDPSAPAAPNQPPAFNPVTQFDAGQSSGLTPWSYGHKAAGLADTFVPFDLRRTFGDASGRQVEGWGSRVLSNVPHLIANPSPSNTWDDNRTKIAPLRLNLHPGASGEYAVLRFTAPATGPYSLAGGFFGHSASGAGTTTDVHILRGNAPVFDREVNGFGATVSFAQTVSLAAGETLDFAVGYGSNRNFNDDSTGLALAITATVSDPAGLAALRAKMAAPALPDPRAGLLATGPVVPLPVGKNLLANPDFQVTRAADGTMQVAGWTGVRDSNVTRQNTGGPFGDGFVGGIEAQGTMLSAPILLSAGPDGLVLSGWFRTAGLTSPRFRFLDSAGNPLGGITALAGSYNDSEWGWGVMYLVRGGSTAGNRRVIPAQAESVQFYIQGGTFNVTGFSVRALTAAEAAAMGAVATASSPSVQLQRSDSLIDFYQPATTTGTIRVNNASPLAPAP